MKSQCSKISRINSKVLRFSSKSWWLNRIWSIPWIVVFWRWIFLTFSLLFVRIFTVFCILVWKLEFSDSKFPISVFFEKNNCDNANYQLIIIYTFGNWKLFDFQHETDFLIDNFEFGKFRSLESLFWDLHLLEKFVISEVFGWEPFCKQILCVCFFWNSL